jgi:ATP-binding cassette subfamily F protein 3
MMTETDPNEAVRLHDQLTEISGELSSAEERWMELSDT